MNIKCLDYYLARRRRAWLGWTFGSDGLRKTAPQKATFRMDRFKATSGSSTEWLAHALMTDICNEGLNASYWFALAENKEK